MKRLPKTGVSFHAQMRTCGKPGCHCAAGDRHGPYWYAYWMKKGKQQKRYIGKKLPGGVQG